MYKRVLIHAVIGFGSFWSLYRSFPAALAGTAAFIGFSMLYKKDLEKKNAEKINAGFLDFLICLEPLLKTTGTFPRAFATAASDYRKFHGNDTVSRHLDAAVNNFRMNRPTLVVLETLSEKLDNDEARSFAGSISICEATGGDLVEITTKTVNLLIRKTRVIRDINTALSGKVFEQKIITLMPFILILVFSYASESYMEPLYGNPRGMLIMTAAGLIFLLQWLAGRKIMDIRV